MPRRRMDWVQKTVKTSSDMVLKSCLPAWIIRALRESGVKRMSMMASMSDHELLRIPGIGHRSLALIRAEIARRDIPPNHQPQKDEAGSEQASHR